MRVRPRVRPSTQPVLALGGVRDVGVLPEQVVARDCGNEGVEVETLVWRFLPTVGEFGPIIAENAPTGAEVRLVHAVATHAPAGV